MLFLSENPIKLKLMMLIKKSAGITVDELSSLLGITPMGVRQHLISLERKGVVKYTAKRRGIGRPKFYYKLTDKASQVFPNSYNKLLADILRFLKETDGPLKIDGLFRMRKESILMERDSILPDKRKLSSRISAMAEMLNIDGFMVETEEKSKHFVLKQFHCPISEVAREFKGICKYELELYKELLHKDVSRERSHIDGDPACIYIIPKV